MKSSNVSFLFSACLIIINLVFLYAIVGYKHLVSYLLVPGLTVGILGFASVVTFAVVLTWLYVAIVNRREQK
jgi:hypothetical protein